MIGALVYINNVYLPCNVHVMAGVEIDVGKEPVRGKEKYLKIKEKTLINIYDIKICKVSFDL